MIQRWSSTLVGVRIGNLVPSPSRTKSKFPLLAGGARAITRVRGRQRARYPPSLRLRPVRVRSVPTKKSDFRRVRCQVRRERRLLHKRVLERSFSSGPAGDASRWGQRTACPSPPHGMTSLRRALKASLNLEEKPPSLRTSHRGRRTGSSTGDESTRQHR